MLELYYAVLDAIAHSPYGLGKWWS